MLLIEILIMHELAAVMYEYSKVQNDGIIGIGDANPYDEFPISIGSIC